MRTEEGRAFVLAVLLWLSLGRLAIIRSVWRAVSRSLDLECLT